MNKRGMFRDFELFSTFPESERLLLEDIFVVERYPAGHVFLREGDRAASSRDAICVVVDGRVSVTRKDAPLRSELVPGELFGVVALCTDMPRSATCKAETDVTVAHLDKPAFTFLRSEHSTLAARFELLLARQLVRDLRRLTRGLYSAVESGEAKALDGVLGAD